MLRKILSAILRRLPPPPLTDDERLAQLEAEVLTTSERVWASMRSRYTS